MRLFSGQFHILTWHSTLRHCLASTPVSYPIKSREISLSSALEGDEDAIIATRSRGGGTKRGEMRSCVSCWDSNFQSRGKLQFESSAPTIHEEQIQLFFSPLSFLIFYPLPMMKCLVFLILRQQIFEAEGCQNHLHFVSTFFRKLHQILFSFLRMYRWNLSSFLNLKRRNPTFPRIKILIHRSGFGSMNYFQITWSKLYEVSFPFWCSRL